MYVCMYFRECFSNSEKLESELILFEIFLRTIILIHNARNTRISACARLVQYRLLCGLKYIIIDRE